ncbi:hypothetical protein AB0D11_45895 [Streptomyces monashensis]|uniref:hypothetical protein n=1 Tax=Streptomyces monashensis TaxID=1678012 RepID=UPI0033D04416
MFSDPFNGIPEPDVWTRVVYLRPDPCRVTVERLGVRDHGILAAQEATVAVMRAVGPAGLDVDQLMHRLPGCLMTSAFEPDRCLVAVLTGDDPVRHGYMFEVAAEHDDPTLMPLYSAAVYGWIRWWVAENSSPQQRKLIGDLPPPPANCSCTSAGRTICCASATSSRPAGRTRRPARHRNGSRPLRRGKTRSGGSWENQTTGIPHPTTGLIPQNTADSGTAAETTSC